MPDGDYRLGEQTVTKCLGGVRLADGTLAGSTLTMDQALRNFVSLGLDPGGRLGIACHVSPPTSWGSTTLAACKRRIGGPGAESLTPDFVQLQVVYVEGRHICGNAQGAS